TYFVVVSDSTVNREGSGTGNYLISTANVTVGQLRYSVANLGGQSLISTGSSSVAVAGYARMDADGGSLMPAGMAIFGFRQNNVLVSEAAVPASGLISSGRIYAEVAGPVNTGFAIANPNNTDVTISFYFTDSNGQNFGNGAFVLGASSQIAK